MHYSPTIEDLAPFVGRVAHLAGPSLPLTIDRIEVGQPAPPGLRQPFMLVFRGRRSDPVAPEGLYVCEIEDGASLELYVMPIHTPEPAYQDYQAVFN